MKAFIEAVEAFPDVAPGHQKRAGGLFHEAGLIEIAIQISELSIDGIGFPEAVDAEELEDQGGGCRQAADGESRLHAAGLIDKFAGGEAILLARVDQRVNRSKKIRVWIQQEQELLIARGDALIYRGGESTIFAIRNQVDVCPLADLFQGPIGGRVIDNDASHVGSHLNDGIEARSNYSLRIECYDDRGSSQKLALQYRSNPVCC
jgi:hypothetical protein